MTDPADRPAGPDAAEIGEASPLAGTRTAPAESADGRAVSERTRRAVEAERERREAEQAAAKRRARSPFGIAVRGLRWLRNRQTGPLPRARRVGAVLAAAARTAPREPAALRRLPEDLLAAALAPVRVRGASGAPEPKQPPRSLEPERDAARARLSGAGRDPVELESIADLRVAAVVDEPLATWLRDGCEALLVRPEDWQRVLDRRPPHLLLVADAWWGNGGAWQYRVAWYAHPDALFVPDLRALAGWCAERGVPSVFLDCHGTDQDRFTDAAALLDLVVTPDEDTARRYLAAPNRRGAGVAVAAVPAGPASTVGLLERVAPSCGIRLSGPGAAPLVTTAAEPAGAPEPAAASPPAA